MTYFRLVYAREIRKLESNIIFFIHSLGQIKYVQYNL